MAIPAANQEIVNCYEKLRMTPESIAEDLGFEVEVVKAILLSSSPEYRSFNGKENSKLFNNHDLMQAAGVMRSGMLSENEHIAQRAARFIIDEIEGRNDARVNKQVDKSFNAIEFNERFKNARRAIELGRQQRLIAKPPGPQNGSRVIDVEPIAEAK